MWYSEFNSTFWLSMATMMFTAFGLGIRYCYRSKCDNIDICGCIKIHRNVEAELHDVEQGDEKKEESN